VKAALKNINVLFIALSGLFVLLLGIAILTDKYYLIAIPFGILLFYSGWQSLSFVFFLLIASLPFSTEYQFSANLGTDLPDELLMLVTTGLFFLHLANSSMRNFLKTAWHPLLWCLFAVMCWAFISSLFSTYPVLSIKVLLAKSWYLGAFIGAALLVCTDKKKIRLLALCLAVSMLIVTLLILLRHSFSGFTFAAINDAVQPFFRNHVNYSAMLVCTLPVWYACWRLANSRKQRRMITIVILILLVALILSYARGAWLALIIGITTGWLMQKKWLMRTALAVMIIVSLGLGWLAHNNRYLDFSPDYNTTVFHENFSEHLIATYQLKDVSAAERFYRWIAGFRMIPDHPVTGFGPGTFYHNYKPYAVPAFETWVSNNEEHSTVHNYFLLTAIEQGLPGLLLLLLLTALVLYYAQYLYHRTTDTFYKTVSLATGSIFAMILTLNFLSDLVETDKIGSLFFLCIAVLVKQSGVDSQESGVDSR
jgi:O-antigen ligase